MKTVSYATTDWYVISHFHFYEVNFKTIWTSSNPPHVSDKRVMLNVPYFLTFLIFALVSTSKVGTKDISEKISWGNCSRERRIPCQGIVLLTQHYVWTVS